MPSAHQLAGLAPLEQRLEGKDLCVRFRKHARSEMSSPMLSSQTRTARTDARTGLSPEVASRCGLRQPQTAQRAALCSRTQLVSARSAGLLIPRSQVRVLPGPSALSLQIERFCCLARQHGCHLRVRRDVHAGPVHVSSLPVSCSLSRVPAARFGSVNGISGPLLQLTTQRVLRTAWEPVRAEVHRGDGVIHTGESAVCDGATPRRDPPREPSTWEVRQP